MSFVKLKAAGYGPDGRRLYCKGGGGGGQTYYANQDKLLGVQADIAEGMYNSIYQPYAPKAVASLGAMVDEANSGKLAQQYRDKAGADAGAALGLGLDAASRSTARYGATLNPNAQAALTQGAALQGAAMKSNAMNQATATADSQKWARNYDFYNALSGVPTQAASQIGSAASGYGGMGNAATNTEAANAAGYGQAGGSFAHAIMKADGGIVEKKPGLHLAAGGAVPQLNQLQPWRSRPATGGGGGGPSAMQSVIAGAAPVVAGEIAKEALKPVANAGLDAMAKGTGTAMGEITNALGLGLESTATAAPVVDAAVTPVVTDALATTATEAATSTLGSTLGAAGSAAMAAAPWLLGAYAVGSALDLFADGGEVKARKDMTDGGRVKGPGTATSDDIPAWLSDGEYVLNAESVKLVGKEKLDTINRMGLGLRDAKAGPQTKQGSPALASGGLLGVALGAGVNQYDKLEAVRRGEEAQKFNQNMATQQMGLQQAAAARTAAEHGIKMKVYAQAEADDKAARQSLTTLREQAESVINGTDDPKMWDGMLKEYNSTLGNGQTIAPQSSKDGIVLNVLGADGMFIGAIPFNQQAKLKLLEDYQDRKMRYTSPAQYQAYRNAKTAAEKDAHKHAQKLEEIGKQGENSLAVEREKGRYKTINAGDSLVQINDGKVSPVYTAPESARSAAAKQGPLERDVGYLVTQHGMTKDQALAHLNSAKTMTREQFILKSMQDSIAMGKKPTSEEVANFGMLYDSARQAPATQKPATVPASNSPAPANLDPQIKSLLGIP